MTATPVNQETPVEISLGPDHTEAHIFGDVKAQFNAAGKVTLFTDRPVQVRLADAETDQIHLGTDLKSVVINGSSVQEQKDRSLLVQVRENGSTIDVKPKPPRVKTGIEAGDVLPDGTIFVAKLDDGKALVAAPEDAPEGLDFNDAAKFAKKLKVGGKKGFRVPTPEELDLLYKHRKDGEFEGSYKETGNYPEGWYWTSEASGDFGAHAQRFSNGNQSTLHRKPTKDFSYYEQLSPKALTKELLGKATKLQGSLASVRCVKVVSL